MNEWIVSEQESGASLQGFLKSKLPSISAKAIKRFLDAGSCTLNGRLERYGTCLVGTGDLIQFDFIEKRCAPILKEGQVKVLYKDSDILAIDKPSGISSDSRELLGLLENEFGALKLLHRLDKETSGVLLFACSEKIAHAIEKLFRERMIQKTYLAIVHGTLKSSGVVDNYLGKLKVYQGQAIWGEVSAEKRGGVRAVTHWQVIAKGKGASLLKISPETGRTHQIRVHMSGLHTPILGDCQYGRRRGGNFPYRPQRLLLHAAELSFIHPRTFKKVTIDAPFPKSFVEALKELGIKYG